jgi:hypothetical protein
MNPGDAFLIPDAISTHLYFVIAKLADGTLIFCHCTTHKKHTDDTCVIEPGEHDFVTRSSSVQYASAFDCSEGGLKLLERSIIRRYRPLSPELLARVRQGALDSPQTPDKIKALLK